jgi:hypothetical protein
MITINEAAIVSRANEVLSRKGLTQFFSGTLFATCSAREAAKIETMLIDEYKCGVIVSPMRGTDEYAFDLV